MVDDGTRLGESDCVRFLHVIVDLTVGGAEENLLSLFLFNKRGAAHEMGKSSMNRVATLCLKTFEQRISTLCRELVEPGNAV